MILVTTILIVLGLFLVWFAVSEWQNNYGLIDVLWGAGQSVVAIYLFTQTDQLQARLAIILVFIWGLRLNLTLLKRNWGKPEDKRYVKIRAGLRSRYRLVESFVKVFLLQAVLQLVMLTVLLVGVLTIEKSNNVMMIVGGLIAVFGLGFEALGDWQLKQFLTKRTHRKQIMDQGLWSLTRHPNYFGEVVFWWGIFILLLNNPFSLIGIVSPLLITILINYVSGIPLLEKNYKDRPEYLEYARKTPRMIPLIGDKAIRDTKEKNR